MRGNHAGREVIRLVIGNRTNERRYFFEVCFNNFIQDVHAISSSRSIERNPMIPSIRSATYMYLSRYLGIKFSLVLVLVLGIPIHIYPRIISGRGEITRETKSGNFQSTSLLLDLSEVDSTNYLRAI